MVYLFFVLFVWFAFYNFLTMLEQFEADKSVKLSIILFLASAALAVKTAGYL